jgi:tetratricopeptide (TPR) repeat protein
LLLFQTQTFAQADSVLKIPESSLSWYNPIQNTDSLLILIPGMTLPQKAEAYCEVSYALLKTKPQKAMEFAQKAFRISDNINYNNGKVMSLMLMACQDMPGNDDTIRAIRLLQKAASYFDENTHWTLKYRIWFGIGQRFMNIDIADSSIFYYQKPLLEMDAEEAWLSHIGSYSWLTRFSNQLGNLAQELQYLIAFSNLCYAHPEYLVFVDKRVFLAALEKLPAYYTAHGYYKLAIAESRKVIHYMDSCNQHTATDNMFRAKYLGKIGRAYHHWGRYDSAVLYHDSALFVFNQVYKENYTDLTNNTSYPVMQEWDINVANQLEEKAGVLIKTGKLAQARSDVLKSVELRTGNNDPLGVGMSFDKLGEIEALLGNFTAALSYYDSAIVLKQKFFKDFVKKNGQLNAGFWTRIINESICYTYLQIGNLYQMWDKTNLAIQSYNKALRISQEIDHVKSEAESLTALGNAMLAMHLSDSALLCYQKAKHIYQDIQNRPGLGAAYESMADYYQSMDSNLKIIPNYEQALVLFEELEMPGNMARVHYKLGILYYENKNLNEALKNFEIALALASQSDTKMIQLDCHEKLSEVYEKLKRPQKALEHHKEYARLKDEIYTLETSRQLTEIETQYESEQHRQKIQLLEQEKQLNESRTKRTRFIFVGTAASIFLTLMWLLLYIRQNRLKNEQEHNRLQQQLLRSQMNPHFIFNALSSVQNSIISDQPAVATKYLSRFSKLMRSILESSSMELISLDEELATVENYLALQKIRFTEKFDYSIRLDEAIDTDNTFIPPMLTQPFIENAIEHGFKNNITTGHLLINYELHDKTLEIEITDDGMGREKSAEYRRKDKTDYKSMATNITLQRIDALNKRKKRKISMEVLDLHNEEGKASGTTICFSIPI